MVNTSISVVGGVTSALVVVLSGVVDVAVLVVLLVVVGVVGVAVVALLVVVGVVGVGVVSSILLVGVVSFSGSPSSTLTSPLFSPDWVVVGVACSIATELLGSLPTG